MLIEVVTLDTLVRDLHRRDLAALLGHSPARAQGAVVRVDPRLVAAGVLDQAALAGGWHEAIELLVDLVIHVCEELRDLLAITSVVGLVQDRGMRCEATKNGRLDKL